MGFCKEAKNEAKGVGIFMLVLGLGRESAAYSLTVSKRDDRRFKAMSWPACEANMKTRQRRAILNLRVGRYEGKRLDTLLFRD